MSQTLVPEIPPTLTYDLAWATSEEREQILAEMRKLDRQTMNLTIMPKSRLLRMRAPEAGNRIVGWAGLDAWYTPEMAEFFSLYVYPEFRSYLVGLMLETMRAAFIVEECPHIKRVLVRMEASSNTSLLRYRLGSELMLEAKPGEITAETLALCRKCELFGNHCAEQAYLWVDVQRFLERGNERLGFDVSAKTLPMTFTLDPNRMRKAPRPIKDTEPPPHGTKRDPFP